MPLLRKDVLKGRRVVVSGAGTPLGDALSSFGAQLELLDAEQLPADENRVGEWARERAPFDALVHCAEGAFGDGGEAGLRAALEETWGAVREIATGALIDAPGAAKLLLIAPRSDAGPLADAARAGIENLVRTLSVEWARYGVAAVMLAPGPRTTEEEVAQIVCFLVSEAGDYFSGCRLELGTLT